MCRFGQIRCIRRIARRENASQQYKYFDAKKFKEVFTEAQKITREDPTLPEEATEEREAEPEPEPETEAPGGVTDKLASLTVREGAES
ncbi:hypothetical protein FJT64_020505 [Amphibalanus amphitrite]|uniref:Uncharacterized protein n=1 Tax=Amphibalanus amphitrite TaxID=1232801 RepID=A0A6A4X1I6_AMPAM|nr:hypothetical protein FJT64_020505 [Amphibalanus amphitrite]